MKKNHLHTFHRTRRRVVLQHNWTLQQYFPLSIGFICILFKFNNFIVVTYMHLHLIYNFEYWIGYVLSEECDVDLVHVKKKKKQAFKKWSRLEFSSNNQIKLNGCIYKITTVSCSCFDFIQVKWPYLRSNHWSIKLYAFEMLLFEWPYY